MVVCGEFNRWFSVDPILGFSYQNGDEGKESYEKEEFEKGQCYQ